MIKFFKLILAIAGLLLIVFSTIHFINSGAYREHYLIGGIVVLIFITFLYIHLTNWEVNYQLRVVGFIGEKLFNQLEKNRKHILRLIGFINENFINLHSGTGDKMTIILPLRSDNIVITEEHFIETRTGRQMRVLVFKPVNQQPSATGFLWIHGGGYIVGAPDFEFRVARQFVATSNTVIVSPQYTLSNVAPFPAGFNDTYDALLWMKNNAINLGINPDQLFVGGGSAGGGLATSVALYARDTGDVNIAFLMPLYPMINDRMNTPSAIGNTSFFWNSRRNYKAWKSYLNNLFLSHHVPTYAAPARERNFSGLPPTYTFVGDLDPFSCETLAFINNLRADGVWVEMDVYKGAFHGFELLAPNAKISKEAMRRMLEVFKYATENFFAAQC